MKVSNDLQFTRKQVTLIWMKVGKNLVSFPLLN